MSCMLLRKEKMIRIILQRTAKDMLQVKVIMDRDENVLTSEESVLRGW